MFYKGLATTWLSSQVYIDRYVTSRGLDDNPRFGRLGNQLFQIAATIGVAYRNRCAYVFPSWKYSDYFQKNLAQSTWPVSLTQNYYEESFTYQTVNISGSTNLAGYFQSEKYFSHCEDEIRKVFTLHPQITQKIISRFGTLLRSKTCSMHVRRTDYLENSNFLDLTSTSYYEEAFRKFAGDTTFIVFSDDIAWCKRRFQDKRFIFIEGMNEIYDLFVMSHCQSHIIANSSFSWWGAWLNANPDKIVIAPARWFAGEFANRAISFCPGPPHTGFHDTKDLLPESWLRI